MTTVSSTPASGGTGIAVVAKFFGTKGEPGGYKGLTAFRKDWEELTPADKDALRTGIADGSLTY
jgi:hypothetical protein